MSKADSAASAILFVSRYFPVEGASSAHGVYQRMGLFLDALGGMGRPLRLLFFVSPELTGRSHLIEEAQQRYSKRFGVPVSVTLCPWKSERTARGIVARYVRPALSVSRQELFKQLVGEPQLSAIRTELRARPACVFAHKLHVMHALRQASANLPTTFMDMDDVEHKRVAREIAAPPHWGSKPMLYGQLPALVLCERSAVKSTAASFVCSKVDRDHLTRWLRLPRVEVVPNVVTMPPEGEASQPSKTILFVGTFTYRPNVEAAKRLAFEILPKVSNRVPDARVVLVGARPENVRAEIGDVPGVTLAGFVDDIAACYRQAALVCCPITSGSGTRIKIIEAAAYELPIVSTSIGAEGLDFEEGQEIVLRDSAAHIADACVSLLQDPARRRAMGAAARRKAAQLYDREAVIRKVRKRLLAGLSPS